MSISIEQLTSVIDTEQLTHQKLDAKDFMNSGSSRPENLSLKVQVPQYFRDIFAGFSIQIHAPSSVFNSLWHCILYVTTHDRYVMASWEQKKKYVEKLVEEIDEKINVRFNKGSTVMRNTTYAPLDLKFRAKFITDAVLFGVTSCLNINVLVLNSGTWNFYYGDPVINMKLPLVILNKDHQQCYSVVSINEQSIFDVEHIVNQTLQARVPERNMYLASILKERSIKNRNDADTEFVRLVKGQSKDQAQYDNTIKQLTKLKLVELKEMVKSEGKNISSLTGRITKAKIIELLVTV